MQGSSLWLDPVGHAWDPDGDALQLDLVSGPGHGTLTRAVTGSGWQYTPAAGFLGTDSFSWRVFDGVSFSNTATCTLFVTDQAPQAGADYYQTSPSQALVVGVPSAPVTGVLANDQDPHGRALQAWLLAGPAHGSLDFLPNGHFLYRPDPGFVGTDSFVYAADNGASTSGPVNVTIEVAGPLPGVSSQDTGPGMRVYPNPTPPPVVNEPPVTPGLPVGLQDSYSVHAHHVLSVGQQQGVLANDLRELAPALAAVLVDGPSHGTVLLDPEGSFVYTPAPGFVGLDVFTYRPAYGSLAGNLTSVKVLVTNTPPVAFPDAYAVHARTSAAVPAFTAPGVLANDRDADGDPLLAVLVAGAAHGDLVFHPDGTFTYAPLAGFVGTDTFVYRVWDGAALSAPAEVRLVVHNTAPTAFDHAYHVHAGSTFTGSDLLHHDVDPDGDPLIARLVSGPAHGKLTLTGDGTFTYRPDRGFVGLDTFSYLASDGIASSAPSTVRLLVTNTAPVALPDAFAVHAGSSLSGSVTANDLDVDGDTLRVRPLTGPANGLLQLAGNGQFIYTPLPGFVGSDAFTYELADGLLTDVGTVRIEVTNTAPLAHPDVFSVRAGSTYTSSVLPERSSNAVARSVLENDQDADSDQLRARLVQTAGHGVLAFRSDGTFTYTPVPGFVGTDAFTYQAFDSAGSGPVTVRLSVYSDSLQAADDVYLISPGESLNVPADRGVLHNDRITGSGEQVRASLVLPPTHGWIILRAGGSFTYRPDGSGLPDSFTYRLSDGSHTPSTATVRIEVRDLPPPTAEPDAYVAWAGTPLTVVPASGVLHNDTWFGPTPRVVLVSGTDHGGLTLDPDGGFHYTPHSNFQGTDSFTYRLWDGRELSEPATVSIEVRNTPPVSSPDEYWVAPGASLLIGSPEFGLADNDFDHEDHPLWTFIVQEPTQGRLQGNGGQYTYVANPGASGTDTFTYRAWDGRQLGEVTSVTVHLAADWINALPDIYLIQFGQTLTANVLANDRSNQAGPMTAQLLSGPDGLTIDAAGNLQYTAPPPSNTPSAYSQAVKHGFTYRVTAGSLSQDVAGWILVAQPSSLQFDRLPLPVNDKHTVTHDQLLIVSPDKGLTANDTASALQRIVRLSYLYGDWPSSTPLSYRLVITQQPSKGSLSVAGDGSFVYLPHPGESGTDSFVYGYAVTDTNGGSPRPASPHTATVTITIKDEPPLVQADTYRALHDYLLHVEASNGVLANDSDPDAVRPLTAQLVSPTQHGELDFFRDGSFVYRPHAGFVGTDTFRYAVGGVEGLVTLTVEDRPPVAHQDAYVTDQGVPLYTSIQLGVLANDTEPEGDPLETLLLVGPQFGRLTWHSSGAFVYTPQEGFAGTDQFVYWPRSRTALPGGGERVQDGTPVTVSIQVRNALPTADAREFSLWHDTALILPGMAGLLSEDGDLAGGVLQVELGEDVHHGTLELHANGGFTYRPDPGFVGTDLFTYRVHDGLGISQVQAVTLRVRARPPVSAADAYATHLEAGRLMPDLYAGVLANDSDPEDLDLRALPVDAALVGTVSLNPLGSFTYTPAPGFVGTDLFTYRVDNGLFSGRIEAASVEVGWNGPVGAADSYEVRRDSPLAVGPWSGLLANDGSSALGPLTVLVVDDARHGTLTASSGGSFLYTPAVGFVGTDLFTYRVGDGHALSAVTGVRLEVRDEAPVSAGLKIWETTHGRPLVVGAAEGLLAGASDANGEALSVQVVHGPTNGMLTLQSDGAFVYQPAAGFVGTDSFTYQVHDGLLAGAVGTVLLSVTNAAPTGQADAYTTPHGRPLVVPLHAGVLANDRDPDGDFLQAVLAVGPAHGTLELRPTGSFVYTPVVGFVGTDAFSYRPYDGHRLGEPITVVVAMTNTVPTVAPDVYLVAPGTTLFVPVGGGVLANDRDADGDFLTLELVTGVSHGVLSLGDSGSFVYTPRAGYRGTDTFTYRVGDGVAWSDPVPVRLVVTAPASADDHFRIEQGQSLVRSTRAEGLLRNDWAVSEEVVAVALVRGPAHGTLSLAADGTFTYTPDPAFVGVDSFRYQAHAGAAEGEPATAFIHVEAALGWSNAAVQDHYVVPNNRVLARSGPRGLLGNDRPPSATAQAVLLSGPSSGQLQLDADGSFSYTPEAQFVGDVTFTYRLGDGADTSNVATVVISVREAVEELFPATAAPRYTVGHDQLLVVDSGQGVAAAYPAGEPWLVELVSGPAHGSLVLGPDGSFRYRGNAGFHGTDAFQFRLVGTWLVSPVLEAVLEVTGQLPVAADDRFTLPANRQLEKPWWEGLLVNDTLPPGDAVQAVLVSGPAHGTLTLLTSGSFLYTPAADFVGLDQFAYRLVSDLGQSEVATVVLEVVNRTPVAEADTYRVRHDTQLSVVSSGGVLANDRDPDGDFYVADLLSGPAHGTLVLYASGAFVYRPDPLFVGTDTFVYRADDGLAHSEPTVVSIAVYNDTPQAVADHYQLPHDRLFTVSAEAGVLANDTDTDGDRVGSVLLSGPTHGTLVLHGNGSFAYAPLPGFVGTDTFVYQAVDALGAATAATVTLEVKNTAPTAAADHYMVPHNRVLPVGTTAGVLANDRDAEGDALATVLLAGPEHGTLTLTPGGGFLYVPAPGFAGIDSFVYAAYDGLADTPATVTLEVTNAAPTAQDVQYSVPKDTALFASSNRGVLSDRPGDDLLSMAGEAGGATYVDETYGSLRLLIPGGDRTLLATAGDADGDLLRAVLVAGPAHGTLTLTDAGAFLYVPDPGFVGTDTFEFAVSDGIATSATATATITVAPQSPPAEALTYLTRVNGFFAVMEVSEGLLRDSLTRDAAHLRVELVPGWDVEHGQLDLREDGTFSYQPQADYVGYDGFAFVVVDDRSGTSSGPYLVTLVVANDRPTAVDRTFATVAGQTLSVNAHLGLLSTAADANGHALTAEVVSQPAYGSVVVSPDGSFTYTPPADYTGQVTFTYRVTDGLIGQPTRNSNGSLSTGDGVSEVYTVTVEVLNDALQVMELLAEAYLESEQGRIAQRQAAAGRPLAIADAQREFAAHAAFSQAVRAAITAVQDQYGTAAPSLRATLLDAETDYAAAEAAAAGTLRATANAAAVQRWTQEAAAEEAYRQQRLLAEAAWRGTTEQATAQQLAAAAALDEAHRLSTVALVTAHRDASAATEAVYVQADAAAHLQLAGELAALRGSQDAQRLALAVQRDQQLHALETAARNTFAAIENVYDTTVSIWHDAYLADLAPHVIWHRAQIDAVRTQYNQAVLASGAAYAAGADDRAQTAVLDLAGQTGYLAEVSAALNTYDAAVEGLRQQYRQAVANARLQRDQAHVAAGLALDADHAALQAVVIARQTQDDQEYASSVIAAQAAFASARGGAEASFELSRHAALATHAGTVFALSVSQEGAENLAWLAYRTALVSAMQTYEAGLLATRTTHEQSREQADAQLRQDRLSARQGAENREAAATATLDAAQTAARVAFEQERVQVEAGYHQAIGPAWLASNDIQWGAVTAQQQAVRGHQRTSDATIAAATVTLNQTVAAQAELRDQHDYNAFTHLQQSYFNAISVFLADAAGHRVNWANPYSTGNAAYAEVQRALALATVQADIDHAQAVQQHHLAYLDATAAAQRDQAAAVALAQVALQQQTAAADLAAATVQAQAGTALNVDVVRAHYAAQMTLASATTTRKLAEAAALRQWQAEIHASNRQQRLDEAAAVLTWQTSDIAAAGLLHRAEVVLAGQYGLSVSLAASSYRLAVADARQTWDLGVALSAKQAELALVPVGVAYQTSLADARRDYERDVFAALGQRAVAAWDLQADATAQGVAAQADWEHALLQADIDLAGDMHAAALPLRTTDQASTALAVAAARRDAWISHADTQQTNWADAQLQRAEDWLASERPRGTAADAWADAVAVWEQVWIVSGVLPAALLANEELIELRQTYAVGAAAAVADHAIATVALDVAAGQAAWDRWHAFLGQLTSAAATAQIEQIDADAALWQDQATVDLAWRHDLSATLEATDAFFRTADLTYQQAVLSARDALVQALAIAGHDQAAALADAVFAHDEAVADAEQDWVERVWTAWDGATQLRLAQESDAAEDVQLAQRDLHVTLATNHKTLADAVAALSYPLDQRARDQVQAQQTCQRAKDEAYLLRRVRNLEQEKARFATATAEELRYVSPANPRGTPPPPLPQRPKSDDIIEQLLFDLDQASRLGVSLRAGDLRAYGANGNASAFEAMVQASQLIQALGLHLLNTALMVGSFIPGPIGILSNGISMLLALANGDEASALEMGIGMVARMNPCGRALLLRSLIRSAKVVDAQINLERAYAAWQRGDYLTAGTSLLGAVSSTATFLKACFTAGTPIRTEFGAKPIEELRDYYTHGDGCDWVLARDEFDDDAPVRPRRVLRRFVTEAEVLELRVQGRTIGTTAEHPFFVRGQGWTKASELQPGDELRLESPGWVRVEAVVFPGRVEPVYNVAVADDHTYFVGSPEWGWSVWAHNAYHPGSNPATRKLGEQFRRRAQELWNSLPDGKRYGATIAVTGINGREVVVLYANIGRGPRQFSQAQINRFRKSVEDAGGMFIHTSGKVHAEQALHQAYPTAPAIGISNPNGPCSVCRGYFQERGYFNLFWPDR